MKNIFKIFILTLTIALTSCGSKEASPNYSEDIDIYLLENSLRENECFIGVWKNGVRQPTYHQPSDHYYMSSIEVSGNDIYVGGFFITKTNPNLTAQMKAVIMKNGIPMFIEEPDRDSDTAIIDIAISGKDIYAVGYEQIGGGKFPALWKNGIKQKIDYIGGGGSIATSVAISGDDVYIIGDDNIWKNNVKQHYPTNCNIVTITTSDNNVCLVGSKKINNKYIATAWVNDKEYTMTDFSPEATESYASSAIVSGNDILIVGTETIGYEGDYSISSAVLWVNGIRQELGINSHPNSVVVSRNNVYVAGIEFKEINNMTTSIPVIWKNQKKFYPKIPSEVGRYVKMIIVPRS